MSAEAAATWISETAQSRSRDSRIRLLGLTLGAVTSAFIVIGAWVLLDSRRETWSQAQKSLENLTFSIGHAINRNFELLDLSLRSLNDTLNLGALDRYSQNLRRAALFDPSLSAGYVDDVRVLDRTGQIVLDSANPSAPSAFDLSDRKDAQADYFLVHQGYRNVGLFIGAPTRSEPDGPWHIAISRRLASADGAFNGVVVAMLRTSYFDDIARRFELGDGAMGVTRDDGMSLEPEPDGGAARGVNSETIYSQFRLADFGHFVGHSERDGRERLYAFAKLANVPVYVWVAYTTDDLFAAWRRKAVIVGGILATLSLAAAALGVLFVLELRRRRQAENEAQKSEARYRLLAENSGDVIVLLGLDGCRRYVSGTIRDVLGYAPDELVGEPMISIVHPGDRAIVDDALQELRAGANIVTVRFRCVRADRAIAWMEARVRAVQNPSTGACEEMIANLRDVSLRIAAEEKMTAAAEELAQLAATDGLTGLANRRHFDEMLEREWRRAGREQLPVALLMLDADMFKSYNDTYGHQRGDDVLRTIADCIRQQTRRPGDVAARYGGEEFAVILPATDVFGGLQVADNIRRSVAARGIPHVASQLGFVTVSAGVSSLVIRPETTQGELLAAADAALYEAKRAGRNRVAHLREPASLTGRPEAAATADPATPVGKPAAAAAVPSLPASLPAAVPAAVPALHA